VLLDAGFQQAAQATNRFCSQPIWTGGKRVLAVSPDLLFTFFNCGNIKNVAISINLISYNLICTNLYIKIP
jgi:hypothetical protein